jgi:hypothetical protein
MLKTIRRCSCHLHGEYVMVGRFWKPGQAVGGEMNLTVLIGGAGN